MTGVDIEKYVHLVPEDITEEEKDTIYPDFCSFQVPRTIDLESLIKLFIISQELLRFKGEQVDSLITELDNLAVKLGEEEAKQNENYIKSVEDLRSPTSRDGKTGIDGDDYQRKLVKMEIQSNRLLSDLQEKEQELINEKKELERLSTKISNLEEENKVLKNELLSTQQELASSASLKLMAEEQDYPSAEKYQELTELLRQKNKHITQLLNDIEDIEKENTSLKDKLSVVRDELAEGTEQMSKLSMERISLSSNVDEFRGKVLQLEQENIALRSQISELVVEKETQNKQIENSTANFDEKLQQLKETLQKKDIELATLKSQLNVNSSSRKLDDTSHLTHLSTLTKTLEEREKQIAELQQQLKQATIDLNESTQLLEEQKKIYKSRFDKNFESHIVKQLKKKLEQTEARIAVLEAKAKHAEEDSLKKAEEVTELIIQLREYESGTYGLEDAMLRIKDLQKQKQVRDNQIEQLVQNLNQFQDEVNLLEQENQILREKLGISPNEQIVTENFSLRNREKQNKMSELSDQLEKSNNELVTVKLENRSLKKQISSLHAELNFHRLSASDTVDTGDNESANQQEDKITEDLTQEPTTPVTKDPAINEGSVLVEQLQEIIDENEGLRKGMHEILESIRNQDGSSFVQIESQTLEQLLEALDSRHVSGWYQPGMRLQAQIHHLNGVNKTLREELHEYRMREEELYFKLHDTSQRLKEVQETVSKGNKSYIPVEIPELKLTTPKLRKSISYSEAILRPHYDDKELKEEKEKCKILETDLEKLRDKLSDIQEQMNKINDQYNVDKESWHNVRTSMQKEIEKVRNNEANLQLKSSEYEKSLELIRDSPDDIQKAFVENTFRISSLKIDLQQLHRKYQSLLEIENQMRQERDRLTNELYSLKQTKDQEILQLRRKTDQLAFEIQNHLDQLNECVPSIEHEKVKNEFSQLTVKHKQVIHKQILIQSEKDQLVSKLQQEVASLCSQKIELEVLLKETFEDNQYLKCCTTNNPVSEELATMAKQLASMELDIVNKKQNYDHMSRMYELTKEQLAETESRCKYLEEQLELATENNAELQLNEANLNAQLLQLPSETEFEELTRKLRNSENNMNSITVQKQELEEVVNIAQDQIKSLEEYNRYQDFEYDSLQRRILELQSLSDDKMIIDRLTKELLLVQKNGVNANGEVEILKDKLVKLESEVLETKLKLTESENDYNRLKKDSNNKIRTMFSIIYELQKRYLGSFPLVKEELCFDKLLRIKEENYAITTLLLDMKFPIIRNVDDEEFDQYETSMMKNRDGIQSRSKLKIQGFNMRLIIEGLQNRIQIYEDRLDKQDKHNTRLEEEIIHADKQCQEFLLYWSPRSNIKLTSEIEDLNNKFTQTAKAISTEETKFDELSGYDKENKLKQANSTINELQSKLNLLNDELRSTREQLASLMTELKEKELIISSKEREIMNLQKIATEGGHGEEPETNENDENSIKKQALKTTIDSLQNIIKQKEETIERLQNSVKKSGEDHQQNMLKLQKELKSVQETLDSKEYSYSRLKAKLDIVEKIPNEKRSFIDSYLTKIHKLEDELNEANEKIEQLSSQLATSNQQAEVWSRTAEERLKTLQNMKHELDTKHSTKTTTTTNEGGKISYSSLLQIVKERSEEIERLNQTIDDYKKRLGSGEKLPGYRDRLKTELERYKRKAEHLEQKEKEDKAEIQRLKNQIISRPQSSRKKDALVTPKEEQLMKKVKTLEEQVEDYAQKEKKWKENRKIKCDEEVEKWQNRKRYQQNYDKLRQQLKDQNVQLESLKASNERLKETIIRLEKERFAFDSKLKAAKIQSASVTLVEELQKANSRLEEELRLMRKSSEISSSASLTSVIEAQERKIMALEIAQKGDLALAEEIERLNERKSQLQNYNVHLEKENMRLKLELDELKPHSKSTDEVNETIARGVTKVDVRSLTEDVDSQLKGSRKKNGDLEKAVLVLRRLVEKLQAENKKLHVSKIAQLQEKNQTEKMQLELQNLQENYLDSIEKAAALDKELQMANDKAESLQKLINRLQNGDEISSMNAQLLQKNQLLSKVKVLLKKAATREKELVDREKKLIDKVNNLQKINSSSFQ